jgi:PleD family two-component response regulator
MSSGLVKVLLIDRDPRRMERISFLKEHGYKVFPALDVQQARDRCKPGVYDLIVVNSGDSRKRRSNSASGRPAKTLSRQFC